MVVEPSAAVRRTSLGVLVPGSVGQIELSP